MLQLLISSNSDVSIPPARHIFERFAGIFELYGNLAKRENAQRLVRDLLNDEPIREWGLDVSVSEFCSQLEEPSVKGIISRLFQLYACKEGKVRWADKTPQHCFHTRAIREVFPEAKFIHLIRDGRDVAESLSRVYIGPKSMRNIANRWKRYIVEFNRVKMALPRDRYIEVYYEDLVRNPQGELERIFDFVGLRASGLRQQLKISSDSLDVESYPHFAVKSSVSAGKVGVFKRRFSYRDLQVFESIAGAALDFHGYALVTDGNAKLSLREKLNFAFEDKVYRFVRKLVNPSLWPLVRKQLLYYVQNVSRRLWRTKLVGLIR